MTHLGGDVWGLIARQLGLRDRARLRATCRRLRTWLPNPVAGAKSSTRKHVARWAGRHGIAELQDVDLNQWAYGWACVEHPELYEREESAAVFPFEHRAYAAKAAARHCNGPLLNVLLADWAPHLRHVVASGLVRCGNLDFLRDHADAVGAEAVSEQALISGDEDVLVAADGYHLERDALVHALEAGDHLHLLMRVDSGRQFWDENPEMIAELLPLACEKERIKSIATILLYAPVTPALLREAVGEAVWMGNPDVAELLVAWGACTWNECLLHAAGRGNLALVKRAVERGAAAHGAARVLAHACDEHEVADWFKRRRIE
jgi:hypothetical protein